MKNLQSYDEFLNEALFQQSGGGHAYTVEHKVGDVLELPILGKCTVKEIGVKLKKAYTNPWTATGKNFSEFEPFKIFPKTTHSPKSIGDKAIVLEDKHGDSVVMYQYESGGKVWTQYAMMN
jgi:hypothetical protein